MSRSRSIWISNLHGTDGRLVGSYVYFLCCAGESRDTAYIKIGVSDKPTQRLLALVNNCALRPLTFGVCNVRSKFLAFKIETELHHALQAWRQQGEWFKFAMTDKPYFSETRESILKAYRSSAWPMMVSVTGVMPVVKSARRRSLLACRLIKRRGDAYHDFVKAGGEKA